MLMSQSDQTIHSKLDTLLRYLGSGLGIHRKISFVVGMMMNALAPFFSCFAHTYASRRV